MADPQKTEQPTKKRVEKAREEGQVPSARHFIAGMQFCLFVTLLQYKGAECLNQMVHIFRTLLSRAFATDVNSAELMRLGSDVIFICIAPLMVAGAAFVVLGLALQLGVTKMGFSVKKLAPDLTRLSPLSKLRQLPGQNFSGLMQAVIMLPVFCVAIYGVVSAQLDRFIILPLANVRTGMDEILGILQGLLWKAAGLFLVFGFVELFREKRKHMSGMKMTKQEIKDESKESDGNPQIKAKIRALRRDLSRRRMMKEVPTATAVIVNPTHFAVALKYDPDSMAAPLVVAKGKNYLALRIREKALSHQVPLIENPPLAQALYKSVDVGQEIPAHLYKAVAEILAYIFRLMNRK
jgi:flagellar biosynthesis protein FlhB